MVIIPNIGMMIEMGATTLNICRWTPVKGEESSVMVKGISQQ
jgi:hypothetical protein